MSRRSWRAGAPGCRALLGLLALVVGGCTRPEASTSQRASPATDGSSASLTASRPQPSASASSQPSASASSLASANREPPMPGPGRRRGAAAVALNEGCVACHPGPAAEWRGSHHQRASVNPAYLAALAIEPMAFCRGCHTPEGDPERAVAPHAVRELGVGCVTCHVTEEGQVLAAARASDTVDEAPHALRRSATFAQSGGCAGCHEFRFPAGVGDGDGSFMQTTVREHARSSSAARPCADCHMRAADGHRSHAFANVRDPAWLRSNLEATAVREGEGEVTVTLTPTAPGHAFPSGDLFRRLEVGVELHGADGRPGGRQVQHLMRHFALVPGAPGQHLIRDGRVLDQPRVLTFALDPPAELARPVRVTWWVTYQRVATVGLGRAPEAAKVESSVPLGGGTLP